MRPGYALYIPPRTFSAHLMLPGARSPPGSGESRCSSQQCSSQSFLLRKHRSPLKRWLCRPGRSQRFPRVNPRRRRKQRRASRAEPVSSAPEPLPSTPAEPLPSSSAPLPSSEQAFPSSPDPWSSSTNYTTAQTTVVPAPVATGPYGGSATKNSSRRNGFLRRTASLSLRIESDSARCVG